LIIQKIIIRLEDDSIFVGQQHVDIRGVRFVSETNNTDSDNFFLTYNNPDENIRIKYPLNWEILEPDESGLIVILQSPQQGTEDSFLENVLIVRGGKVNSQQNLEGYAETIIDQINSLENDTEFVLVDSSKTVLSGIPTYKIEYTTKFNEMNFKKSAWIMAIDDKYYVIFYTAQFTSHSTYIPIVQKIIESFEASDMSQEIVVKSQIPDWIRNNASWWVNGTIDDKAFVGVIQYLIKEGIIQIPETTKPTTGGSQEIPAWIKNNADWWAQGLISDDDFIKGIQFMVEKGIITI